MKKNISSLVIAMIFGIGVVQSQPDSLNTGLLAAFPLDGNTHDATGKNNKGSFFATTPAADRDGISGKAIQFGQKNNTYGKFNPALNLNPDVQPQLTMTFWVKFDQLASRLDVLNMGDKKKFRSLYTLTDGNNPVWCLGCGNEGELEGARITADWTFVAVVYDQTNKAARLVVNNEVWASKAVCRNSEKFALFGGFPGAMDDIRVYSRVLSLQEIEAISGTPVDKNADDYPIYVKEDFKKQKALAERAELDSLRARVVVSSELNIYDPETNKAKIDFLKSGDSLLIIELRDSYAIVQFKGDKKGSVSLGNLYDYTCSVTESGFARRISIALEDLFDFTKLRSWIIVGLLLVLLFVVFKFFYKIDDFFMRMKKDKQSVASGGKAEAKVVEHKPTLLEKIFPLQSFRKWPLYIGAIVATIVLASILWDKHEAEWFLNKGISLLPGHYDATVHWILWGGMWLVFLMVITMFLESFTIAGPLGGSLRVLYLLVVNFIMLVVTFYLFILVLIILAVMFGLFLLSSMGSGTKHRCTRCGQTFYGDHCPNCG